MLNRKSVVYIITGVIILVFISYGVFSGYKNLSQKEPSGEDIKEGAPQGQQKEIGEPEGNNNPAGGQEEEPNNNLRGEEQKGGGLFICADECGDGICQTDVCTDNFNCPCLETPEDCPQDCGE